MSLRTTAVGWLCTALVILVLSAPGIARTSTPVQLKVNQKNPIVWQRVGNGLYMTEDITGGRKCYYYDLDRRTSSELMVGLPTTAAPLGSQIKWLMYMDHYQGLDRLMSGDVDNDGTSVTEWSNRNQVGCGMRGYTVLFGQYSDRPLGTHYAVDLRSIDISPGGATTWFLISDSEKTQFAHDGNILVYRAYYSATDVRVMGISWNGGDEFEIAARNGYEPSVCGNIVAWYETSGTGYNIVAKNLDTGEIRTIAYTTANPPRPEAGRGTVFWEDKRTSATTGVDIYGYDWATGQEFAVTTATGDQLKLRVCDDLVTWTTGTTNQVLWGAYVLPPPKISDLAATRVTSSSVTLGWTSIGETGNPPVAYDLRMRTDGPITDANWSSSTPVTGLPVPQTAGQTESFTVTSLDAGVRYFAMKVQLQAGNWSVLSDTVRAYVSDEIGALRDAPEGAAVSFTGVVSGIGSGTAFYCQRSDRSQAVMVVPKSAQTLTVGQPVVATGALSQDTGLMGPMLQDALISVGTGTETVAPLGMRALSLGGFDARYGGTDDKGPSNLWVRVRIWGKVSYLTTTSGCTFYLNDGSKLTDNQSRGVYVTSRFAPPASIADNKMVSVEGICRLSRANGRQVEVVESTGITVF